MATTPDLVLLHASPGGLLEAPRYDPVSDRVLFADARLGGVFGLRTGDPPEVAVPHRRGIGGLARHADGGLVVTGRNVAHKREGAAGSETSVLLDAAGLPGTVGFNDMVADQFGRLYVGSLSDGALTSERALPGHVYLVQVDGSVDVVAEDVRIPNGMCLAPDGEHLYVCDSGRNLVFSFRVSLESGGLFDRATLIEVEPGVPDGIAVAEDGSLWVAHARAGLIRRYAPDGQPMEAWAIPDALVTSLCFGAADGHRVYITTGGAREGDRGALYVTEASVRGAPDHLARAVASV